MPWEVGRGLSSHGEALQMALAAWGVSQGSLETQTPSARADGRLVWVGCVGNLMGTAGARAGLGKWREEEGHQFPILLA